MFTLLKNAVQMKEIRNRLLFTLMILIIFRIGSQVTVPGVNAGAIQTFATTGIFGLLNTFSGGALSNFSIFSMGVSPYITASIVVQLLQMDILPTFVEWSKQGEVGRRKLNTATRYLTIVIGFFQAFAISFGFNAYANYGLINNPGISTYLLIALVLTAGTMFVTWLGDMITVNGISNGVSIIIFAGIVARMPHDIYEFYVNQLQGKADEELYRAYGFTAALVVAIILVVMLVVYVEQAQRRLPISYSKRPTGASEASWLPLKINSAGVIPVIFAIAFLQLPRTIAIFAPKNEKLQKIVAYFDFSHWIGLTLYVALIIAFCYFYVMVQVNPEKMADNLRKQGSFVPGVRPGKKTEQYITGILYRLTFVGSIFLAAVSVLPTIFTSIAKLPASVQIGGTSLIIVVSVALETVKQLNTQLTEKNYRSFITGRKGGK